MILEGERVVGVRAQPVAPQRRVRREVGERQRAEPARDGARVCVRVGARTHARARHERAARLAAPRHQHHAQRPHPQLRLGDAALRAWAH